MYISIDQLYNNDRALFNAVVYWYESFCDHGITDIILLQRFNALYNNFGDDATFERFADQCQQYAWNQCFKN